jgi:putative cardiolipin synthase
MAEDWRLAFAICTGTLVGACVGVDFERPKSYGPTAEASDTQIGRRVAELGADHPGQSGFYVLSDGIEALGARLAMAAQAERTIDAQYYFILDDPTGHLFVGQLLEAADRGVHVRLLIDDIATRGYEEGMAALHAHPHIEIRLFNPFSTRGFRVLDMVGDFRRINRRMHNKSFTVDGSVTIVGGRNIGAEYFAARADLNFGDLDVIGLGPVARDVSGSFAAYWNSELAVPVDALIDGPEDPQQVLDQRRARYAEFEKEIEQTRYADALRHAIVERLTHTGEALTWAEYEVVWDPPQKGLTDAGDIELLGSVLSRAIDDAETDLFVMSAYFVPREGGVAFFERLRNRGVSVEILTNSLAATDVMAVHAGYAPYREELLELGVELFEMRPDYLFDRTTERTGLAFSRASLHAKGFTIDDERLFIGSFNWDPRSVHINTEMGILIDSPELASQVSTAVKAWLPEASYRVTLNDNGGLRWSVLEDGERVEYTREPKASVWRRLGANLLRLLPIRGQL